jgi:L-threonylcarbamoyladenylate synthase
MAEIIVIDEKRPLADQLDKALKLLEEGEVIAIPTDTLYGLAALISDEKVVKKVYEIKERNMKNPIPILIDSIYSLDLYAREVLPYSKNLAEIFWPGSLTMIFRPTQLIPSIICSGKDGVGIRVADNKIVDFFMSKVGVITGTSANLSGGADPINAQIVNEQIGNKIKLIIDSGPSLLKKGSTVIDVREKFPKLIREGVIPWPKIISSLL